MSLVATARNNMLAAVFVTGGGSNTAKYASLHTADPGTTGINESGAARQAITWAAPSGGVVTGGVVTFPVTAGTYTHIGYWDAAVGGNFVGGYQMQFQAVFQGSGNLPVSLSESQGG